LVLENYQIFVRRKQSRNTYRTRLQSNHEIDDGRENENGEKGYRYIHESQGNGFNEGMVEASELMTSDDRAVGK